MADEPTLAEVLQRNARDPYPESGTEMPRGDARHPPFARAYEPTWRDRLAMTIAGDNSDPFRRLLALRLLGSSGLGPSADPQTPWRALPVAAPAVDAAQAAYNDQPWRFAANALDTGLEGWGVASLPGVLARTAVKPPLPRHEAFHLPVMGGRDGKDAIGWVAGNVKGGTATIAEARNIAGGPNSVGYREMRRVFDGLRDQFPQTANVTAFRVSGARRAAEVDRRRRAGDDRAHLGSAERWTDLNMSVTPEWLRILNEAGKRGIR